MDVDYDQLTAEYDWLVSGAAVAVWVVLVIVFFVAYIRIIQKAGWSGWWILLGFVPIVNVVMFLVFAFARWPVQRELDAARAGRPYPH